MPFLRTHILISAAGALFGLTALAFAAEGPTFDAASVKIAGPDVPRRYTATGGPGTASPGRFHGLRLNMNSLLTRAFDVEPDQIQGPGWLRDFTNMTYYSVEATMPSETTEEGFRKMLQNLLAERFQLKFHTEERAAPAYALTVETGGPKFHEVVPDPAAPSADETARQMRLAPAGGDGFPSVKGPFTMSQSSRTTAINRIKFQERTMTEFAASLGSMAGSALGKSELDGTIQPRVVDMTQLKGKYTFILEYFDPTLQQLGFVLGDNPNRLAANNASPLPTGGGPAGEDVFAAIRKQLGLRLKKTADTRVKVIVIDSLEKTPTAN